jgi:2-polyprenyl-3-methyl-5-hydroxy-6-metoxy-1,4-benzoquinol methylase
MCFQARRGMPAPRDRTIEYSLGNSQRETARLEAQASGMPSFMREFFIASGMQPGMRVLDLGSGAGDTSLAVRSVVGDAGRVLGIDVTPTSLARARERMAAAGFTNVTFLEADLAQDFALDGEFDAIVGTLVLMYLPQREDLLKTLMQKLTPGGIVAFGEINVDGGPSNPASPTWDRLEAWWLRALIDNGTEVRMAMKLRALLTAAGFVDIGGWTFLGEISRGSEALGAIRNRLAIGRSMLPLMRRYSDAPAGELERFDDHEAAVLHEVEENGSIYIGPTAADLWARRPL